MRSNLQPVQIPLLLKTSFKSRLFLFSNLNLEESPNSKMQNVPRSSMIILTDSSRFIVPAWGIHGLEEPKIFESPKTTWSFRSARLAPKDSATGRRDIEAPCRKGSRNSKLRPRCTQRVPVDMSFSFTSGSLQYAKAWKHRNTYWNHTETWREKICKFC